MTDDPLAEAYAALRAIRAAQTDTTALPKALRSIGALREHQRALELRAVIEARRAGMPWQRIADALGRTYQAVHSMYREPVAAALAGEEES